MKTYDHVIEAIVDRPWAILPSTLSTIVEVVRLHLAGRAPTGPELQARIGAVARGERAGGGQANKIGVLPVYGVLMPRASLMTEFSGGTSVQALTRDFRRFLADPQVAAIVLDVDSPGGAVSGIPELGDEIFAARSVKPIIAVANYMAASAAYWLASQAGELVVTPSGEVGSVGVVMAHEDFSRADEMDGVRTTLIHAGKYKVEQSQHAPLADEARAYIQSQVDAFYGQFLAAVARGRDVPVAEVKRRFGEGRMAYARDALRVGMVDRIATLDEVVARPGRPPARLVAAAHDEVVMAKARQRLRAGLPGRDDAERLAIARLRAGDGQVTAVPPSSDPAIVLAKAHRNARERRRASA